MLKSDLSIDAFTQGKVAMMLGYQYMEPILIETNLNLNWDVTGLPQTSETATKVNFTRLLFGAGTVREVLTKIQQRLRSFLNYISQRLN